MRARIAGFSLVELMVALGIVAVLATLAVPRYHQFMVKARRGEAKSNLSHIVSLQSAYKIEYYNYYNADPLSVNGIGYKDGNGLEGQNNCDADKEIDKGTCNYLGFDPEGLDELRYLYQVRDSGRTAVASAASDDKGKYVYPDCSGAHTQAECGYHAGDAVTVAINTRQSTVCRNIDKYCPLDVTGSLPVVIPPPPPVTPTSPPCPANTCCDTDGTTVIANTTGLTCTGGWKGTYVATNPITYGCCHTSSIPPMCDDTLQCCDGTNPPKSQPTNLGCRSWTGTWSSTTDDKGCCQCDPGETFGFDNSYGSCCPNAQPVYTYHTVANNGFCCQLGKSYSHDTTTNTGRCCSTGHAWDASNNVCVTACTTGCCNPQIECCLIGNGRQKTDSDCAPGKYLTVHDPDPANSANSCQCKECNEEYACKRWDRLTSGTRDYTINWDNSTNQCKITNDPNNPDDQFKWVYTSGCHSGSVDRGCNSKTECCTAQNTKKTSNDCAPGKYLTVHDPDPANSANSCQCKECNEEYACKRWDRLTSGTRDYTINWDNSTNQCKITNDPNSPDDQFKWVYTSGCHSGMVVRGCNSKTECCTAQNTKKTSNDCAPGKYLTVHDPDPANSANSCQCKECNEEYACKRWDRLTSGTRDYTINWDNSTNQCKITNDPNSPDDQFKWVYTSGCHSGRVVRGCNSKTECCTAQNTKKTSNDCAPGKYLTVHDPDPANSANSCQCKECNEEYACKRWDRLTSGTRDYTINWDNSTNQCKITNDPNSPDDQFKWVYTSGCHSGMVVRSCGVTPCDNTSQCCVGTTHEVASAGEANLTCDSWSGNWDSTTNNKGCCGCSAGRTVSYDPGTSTGGCCATGTTWKGTSCQ